MPSMQRFLLSTFDVGCGTVPLGHCVAGSSEARNTAQHMGIISGGKMTYGQRNICKKHTVEQLKTAVTLHIASMITLKIMLGFLNYITENILCI